MNMELIQVLAIIFALFAYSRAILRFKGKNISFREFIFWTIIWVAIIVVALIPGVTGWLSRYVGIGRPVDLLVYISIIALFYLLFRLYVKLDELDQNITKIVRKISLDKKDKKK